MNADYDALLHQPLCTNQSLGIILFALVFPPKSELALVQGRLRTVCSDCDGESKSLVALIQQMKALWVEPTLAAQLLW